jgi:outer membrane receptor protein involved in Fe transport
VFLATALLVLLPQAAVHGTVRAEGSLVPIARAVVEIPQLGRGVLTDERGYFTLPDVPPGEWRVRASALGYGDVERTVEVPEHGSVTLELTLPPRPVALEGITIEGRDGRTLATTAGPAPLRVDASVVERMPVLVEPDVLRTLQTLPSVQAASDFSSALYVRGGRPDQTLLMLDGAPLFNPFHLGGLFSAFDPSAIRSVELLPGAFPAGVGDRLSSAIDIRSKEGGRDRVRGSGAIGLISSRLSVDGPLPGGAGSYLVSGRRTYLDVFTDAAHALDLFSFAFPYGFTDAHLKLTHDIGPLGQLSASFYLDGEGFALPDGEGGLSSEHAVFDWGSRMASLDYWQPLGSSWVAEVRAGVSGFHGSFDGYRSLWDDETQTYRTDTTEVFLDASTVQRDLFAAADFTGHAPEHTRRLGVQVDHYLLDHDVDVEPGELGEVVLPFARTDRPTTLAAYAEEEWQPTNELSLRGGLRVLHAGDYGTEWLPRLGLRYAATPSLALSLGASRSAQVLRSLRSEESIWSSLTAYDLISAVPRESGLMTAEDVTLGAEWRKGSTSVRVDAYQKWMHDLPLAPVPADIVEAPLFATDTVRIGKGRAQGLELLARHARGRASFSLSYALTFAGLEAGGERFTPRFERRHLLDASAALPLGGSGLFTARLAWGTGQPYTPVLGVTQGFGYDPVNQRFTLENGGYGRTVLLGEHNAARLPGYFRLDVGARKEFTRRWWGREVTFTPYLSILNVLNTPNVLFAIPEGYDRPRLEYPPQIPIFPTFGIEWKF